MKKYQLIAVTAGFSMMLGTAFAQGGGQEAYDKNCKKCHAADGSGKNDKGEWLPISKTLKLEKAEMLSLISPEVVKISDGDMEKTILKGKGKMKGQEDKLKADEAKVLVAYVRTLQAKKK